MELGIIPLLLICFLFSFFFLEGGIEASTTMFTDSYKSASQNSEHVGRILTCRYIFLRTVGHFPRSHDLFNYIILKIHYLGGYHPHPVYLSWLMITLSTQVIELENFGSFLSFSFLLLISCSQI